MADLIHHALQPVITGTNYLGSIPADMKCWANAGFNVGPASLTLIQIQPALVLHFVSAGMALQWWGRALVSSVALRLVLKEMYVIIL